MSLGGKCHDQVGAVLQEFHTQAVPKTRTASWTTVGRLTGQCALILGLGDRVRGRC
jgi:hypothetical protein